uniref:Uncharacterized protein n=1 Tax=Oryza meridionalis TaxID=40149 RepID=A0A0E0F6N7_9ORYZ
MRRRSLTTRAMDKPANTVVYFPQQESATAAPRMGMSSQPSAPLVPDLPEIPGSDLSKMPAQHYSKPIPQSRVAVY